MDHFKEVMRNFVSKLERLLFKEVWTQQLRLLKKKVHKHIYVYVYCILSCIGCIINKCPDKNCKWTMLLDKGLWLL